ncbi:MAG: hypothetical protein AB7E24_03605 [Novosphingobium sp.]
MLKQSFIRNNFLLKQENIRAPNRRGRLWGRLRAIIDGFEFGTQIQNFGSRAIFSKIVVWHGFDLPEFA